MVEFNCRECGKSNDLECDPESKIVCASCGKKYEGPSEFIDPQKGVLYCGICGCRDLYVQKDFNRKVGLVIVVLGAVLAPFTKFISLGVAALLDLVLYRVLPLIMVCYRCGSIYRDLPLNSSHEPFNLGINDRYRNDDKR